jgi:hypothetical protein
MPGECRINGDLRSFLITDFADHDFVWIMAQDRTKAASKRQAFFLVYRDLRDAGELIFDRVFNRDDFVFVALDFIDRP